jgi:hypothetical protein
MKEDPVAHVTLAGDISGDYLVDERLQDGRLVPRPNSSVEAIIERTGGGRRLSAQEFDEHFGQLPSDDEG